MTSRSRRLVSSGSALARRRLEHGMPDLARAAAARMEDRLPWYRALSAEDQRREIASS